MYAMYDAVTLLQMLTINLEESDCFAAWISVTDVPGLEPKVVDGKGVC